MDADYAVIGLGTIGAMAAWRLAARGNTVIGLEQFGPLHAQGAYVGESRLFRVAAKEGRRYIPLLQRSRELWIELERLSGRTLLHKAGALSIAPAGFPDLEATLAAIREFDLPHEVFDAAELRAKYPQFHIEDDDQGVLDPLGGASRPELGVLSAAEQAERLGASLRYGDAVLGIDPGPDSVRITTESGTLEVGRVVVAAGAWAARLVPELGELVRVNTYALTWFVPKHVERFTPDRLPGFMRDLGELHAFGVPTLDGFSIKLCPHLEFERVDDWADRPTELSREQLAWLGEQAVTLVPDLVPEPSRWSLHADGETADHLPVFDTVADGRVVVGAGLSGNGYKFAPVYGELLAELAAEGASPLLDADFTLAAHRARSAG